MGVRRREGERESKGVRSREGKRVCGSEEEGGGERE